MLIPLRSAPAGPLRGEARIPGDKSISHRALILGALAVGETRVTGLLEAEDTMRTAAALRALGAEVSRDEGGVWHVFGCGIGGLREPDDVLDMGNAGTAVRLLAGVVATHPFTAVFTGDASLRSRPMERIAEPLGRMGARFVARSGFRLPLAVVGAAEPTPIAYRLPVPSAQVKSAILLAALNAPGTTTVVEPEATRDHTEILLRHFGVDVSVKEAGDGGREIAVGGWPEVGGRNIGVPGDPSAAAFVVVAALLSPGSAVTLREVGMNPLRAALFETLAEMGGDIGIADRRRVGGEDVADVTVRASALEGVEVEAKRAPRMIDEYPILAVAAACARGTTVLRGLGELRVKESDRLLAMARGLEACGVPVEQAGDGLTIRGEGAPPAGGNTVAVGLDHRIAMAFLVLGMAARSPVGIDDGGAIGTSFPGFVDVMNGLGAAIAPSEERG